MTSFLGDETAESFFLKFPFITGGSCSQIFLALLVIQIKKKI